jgi:23S rRNA G2069 N7-methylase RlmK/C1962 C5-methylase RlmI
MESPKPAYNQAALLNGNPNHVSNWQYQQSSAALDAGADATIIEHLSQGSDHPVSLHFPEGAYLKGLVCVKG